MFEDIRNFLSRSENLYTGGMPKADQLSDAAQQSVQLVINLAVEDGYNGQSEERQLVESLGMNTLTSRWYGMGLRAKISMSS